MTAAAALASSNRSAALSGLPAKKATTASFEERLLASYDARHDSIQFSVYMFDGPSLSSNAAVLFEGAYARLGYRASCSPSTAAGTVTLEAVGDGTTLGTLSITFDGPRGLQAQTLYSSEIASSRQSDTICEFTRLAIDTSRVGREVLCSLFYVAYVHAHLVRGATDLFIEVNPRHVAFYRRTLGFKQRGEIKTCERVGAPAVLLHLDFRYTALQIERARRGLSVDSSALYKYAASQDEERRLVRRIMASAP